MGLSPVLQDPDEALRRTIASIERNSDFGRPESLAVLAHSPARLRETLAGHGSLGRIEPADMHTLQLGLGIAEKLAGRPVGYLDPAAQIDNENAAVMGVRQQRLEKLLRL